MDFKDIQQYYDKVYNKKELESFPFDKRRYQAWLSAIENGSLHSSERALDIGCGAGFICRYLTQLGFSCSGIDISNKALDIAKKTNPDSHFELSREDGQLNFPNEYFNLITCFGVLEHIIDQDLTVREARRILKKGGSAVFVVPNAASPYFWVGGTEQIFEQPRLYSGWIKLFQQAGFKVQSIKKDPGSTITPDIAPIKRLKILVNRIISSVFIRLSYQLVFILIKE